MHHLHLALLCQGGQAFGQLADDAGLPLVRGGALLVLPPLSLLVFFFCCRFAFSYM